MIPRRHVDKWNYVCFESRCRVPGRCCAKIKSPLLVDGRRHSVFRRRACSPPCRWPWSNPESVDASPLRGPWLSGHRDEVRPRAVQLFVHQHQLEQLHGPVQRSSAEDQPDPGERRQEGERPVRLVRDREVDQNVVRRRPRELPLLLRVHRFRSFARRHQLSPLLLPRLNPRHIPLTPIALPLPIDLDDFFKFSTPGTETTHRRSAVSRHARREWYIISDVLKRRRLCYSRHICIALKTRMPQTRLCSISETGWRKKYAEIESRRLENALKQISIDDGDFPFRRKLQS